MPLFIIEAIIDNRKNKKEAKKRCPGKRKQEGKMLIRDFQ
jgi:hypothetical protein